MPEADTEDVARQVAGNFETWLRKKVIEDAGYDRIVREILNAKLGSLPTPTVTRDRLTPSPASLLRRPRRRKPENLAGGVARVFLGIRLECAQCHDHPFASWKREQFWSLAAFFADVPPAGWRERRSARRDPRRRPRRELTIPGTKRSSRRPISTARTPQWRPRADTREILAEWVTAPDNPYFAKAIVNRVWARFFGVGLIEPVDDLDRCERVGVERPARRARRAVSGP